MEDNILDNIQIAPQELPIIKVIGVGGGGGNAVNYMYSQRVPNISYLVANTDSMALRAMDVPDKLQLGPGLGAGGDPEKAKMYAEESEDEVRKALDDETKMVFITAGMGGGTGTGASPVIARIARDMGILTVGIVTIPFKFEGLRTIRKALRGVAALAQSTDAILVINNEKLKLLFKDLDLPSAFTKADEVLCNAAKSIAEIITIKGYINIDFQDVSNTLKNGNMAIMNVGYGEGEMRITQAIDNALNSPLVNTNDVKGASRILLNFYCSKEHAILMDELQQINDFCDKVGEDMDVRWGINYDDDLGAKVKVTVIATGYSVNTLPGLSDESEKQEVQKPAQPAPATAPVDEVMEKEYGMDSKADKKAEEKAEKKEEEQKPADTANKKMPITDIDATIDVSTLPDSNDLSSPFMDDEIPAWERRKKNN
ncbi:MAG: cell division protein FtsZ [Paludibacteraceae bacterium]|nr:cell division protein FtsZ [Paludibacteraceae bacterium]MBR1786119.1 cell division protein FtsZ [Paludibacteraceae bacterium]